MIHQISEHSKRIIRGFWPGVVFICAFIFVALYTYQFEDVENWVEDVWPFADDGEWAARCCKG